MRVNDYFQLSNRPTGNLSSEQLDLVINPTELMSELFNAYKLKRDSNYELLARLEANNTAFRAIFENNTDTATWLKEIAGHQLSQNLHMAAIAKAEVTQ